MEKSRGTIYNDDTKGAMSDADHRKTEADHLTGNPSEAECRNEGTLAGNGPVGGEVQKRHEELGQAEENHLIDFLYRDVSRIDSLFSQLFQGALRNVDISSGSTNQDGSKLSGGLPVLHGDYTKARTQTDGVKKTYEPHDLNLVSLLSALKPLLNSRPMSADDKGRLCIVSGSLLVRDYRTLKQTAPILFENREVMDGINPANKKQGREIAKLLGSILKIVPMGIEIEVSSDAGEVFIGAAKAECFADNIEDVIRTYGNSMPGQWSILAIADAIDASENKRTPSAIRQSMDDLSTFSRALYSGSDSQYTLTPILIFRRLRIS